MYIFKDRLATGGLQLAVIGGMFPWNKDAYQEAFIAFPFAGAVAGFRYLGGYILEYIKKRAITSADFDSRDESYSWILNWLSEHPYSQKACQFTVSTSISRAGQRLTGEGLDAFLPPIYFLPAPGKLKLSLLLLVCLCMYLSTSGVHFFMYKNRLLWLKRERPSTSSPAAAAVGSGNVTIERIQISTFGRSRTLLQELVLEAQQKFIERDLSRTVVYAAGKSE